MKAFRLLGLGLAAVVLAGGWAYFYFMSRSVDLSAQARMLQAIRGLQEIDNRWNDRLFAARHDPAVLSDERSDPRRGLLPALAAASTAITSPTVGQAVYGVRESFMAKADLMEALGGAVSERLAARGRLETAVNALRDCSRGATDGPALAALYGRLGRLETAIGAVRASSEAPAIFESAASELDTPGMPAGLGTEIAAVLAAARAYGTALGREARLSEDVTGTTTGPHLETLARAFDRDFDNTLAEAERFRVYLLFYSGFLLVVLGYYASRLVQSFGVIRRINTALAAANETLEQRVTERTRELSDALDRLKQSETMLIQTEKMSSLGQMVAGLAHEVNTPLAYVKSSIDAVSTRLPEIDALAAETDRLLALLAEESPDEAALGSQFSKVTALIDEAKAHDAMGELRSLVDDGRHGIDRIAELVANLKNFSRLDRAKVSEFDLNEGIESALVIARNEVKHKNVKKELGALPRIECMPSQLNQVFLNLITNAAHAVPDATGTIILRSRILDPAHVAVDVIDNGHGIPADVLPKIFDPFFTTKEVGKGTGLGLAISYKIVESHGGRIEVDSNPGAGTRFTVVLPVKTALAEAA